MPDQTHSPRGNQPFNLSRGSKSSAPTTFDLCVLAPQLPVAINVARRFPNVTFIPDHRGVPEVKEIVLEPWRRDLREISRLPNVNCKISGLVAYADPETWTPEDLRLYVEHALECFGWERVMFGSDWPVRTLSATLAKWVETLAFLTQNESPENRRKLFCENAQKSIG